MKYFTNEQLEEDKYSEAIDGYQVSSLYMHRQCTWPSLLCSLLHTVVVLSSGHTAPCGYAQAALTQPVATPHAPRGWQALRTRPWIELIQTWFFPEPPAAQGPSHCRVPALIVVVLAEC